MYVSWSKQNLSLPVHQLLSFKQHTTDATNETQKAIEKDLTSSLRLLEKRLEKQPFLVRPDGPCFADVLVAEIVLLLGVLPFFQSASFPHLMQMVNCIPSHFGDGEWSHVHEYHQQNVAPQL